MPIGTHVRHGRTSLPMPVYTPDQAQQELFSRRLGADEFEITTAPPRVGFWGLTFRDKQRLSTEIAPTNLATWIATGQNRVLSFLGLAEERKYVSLGTAMAMRQATHGSNTADTPEDVEQMNVFRWLGNRIRPVQDVTELTQQLTFVDEDFDPEKALAEFQEASPHMVALFEQRGLDLREYLGEAPNAIAFQYRTNQAMARIEAEGRVGQYNGEVGLIRNFSSKMLSGVGNYLLTDPTIVPSMLTPFSLAAGAARGGRIVGTAAHRAGVPTGIAARTSQVIGLPTAAHRAIAGRMGAGAAGALELGLFGAGFNAIDQHQRVQHYNDLYDSEMFQQEFSWGEFALAVGLTSTLGFVIGHATRHRATPTSRRNAVAAIEDHADEHPTAHSHSPQAHAAQAEIDDARVTIARLSGQIADDGDEGHYLFLTDLRFLEQSGLDLAGVSGVMSNLVANVDTGRMTAREAQGVLDSFITEARRRATRIAASPEHQLLRKAKARAATRRAEELGVRVTHLKHDRIDWANPTMRRLLKEEYDQLKAHYDSRPNGVHAVDSTPHAATSAWTLSEITPATRSDDVGLPLTRDDPRFRTPQDVDARFERLSEDPEAFARLGPHHRAVEDNLIRPLRDEDILSEPDAAVLRSVFARSKQPVPSTARVSIASPETMGTQTMATARRGEGIDAATPPELRQNQLVFNQFLGELNKRGEQTSSYVVLHETGHLALREASPGELREILAIYHHLKQGGHLEAFIREQHGNIPISERMLRYLADHPDEFFASTFASSTLRRHTSAGLIKTIIDKVSDLTSALLSRIRSTTPDGRLHKRLDELVDRLGRHTQQTDEAPPDIARLVREWDEDPDAIRGFDSIIRASPPDGRRPAAAPTAVTEANRRHNREMNAYYRRQAEGRDLTDAELEDWMAVRRRLGDEARSPTYNQLTARPLREADVSALLDTWAARARKAEETAMVARLDEADAALEGAGITTHRQVREKWAKNPPRTLAEREQALDEQMTALVRGASDDYVDANWFTAVTRHLGPLTGWVDTLAAARTGKGLTVKSAFQALRALAEELDHTRHSVRTLEDGGGSVVGTAADSNRESLRLMAPMVHRMEKIRQSGKLSGNWGMDLQKIQDFETAIVRHVRKTELSDDPDVQWFAREWERIRDRIGAEGLRNGFFSGLAENYFPHRIRPGMAQSDRLKLIDTLSDLYRTKWMQSSSVHRDTLVDLGYLHRTESGPRGQADWALTDRGREVFGDTIPTRRADLPENVQPEYERALALPVEGQQYSAIERSMRRAVNRLTTTAQTETDGAGRLVVETHRRPVENEAATFLAEAAQDPRMEEFLDMSFFANTRNYLNRVGFSVLNQTRHQTRWGVPGLTMRETAQFARKKLLEAAETPDQVTQVNDGVDIIMRKIAGLEGSLPSVISASNKIGQVGGETAAAATVAAIGPGVGLSTLVESMANMTFQAQSPLDIVRNVGNFLRGMNPVRHRERFQERMGDMSLVLEMNNHHTLNRMSMGMFESDLSWDFTTKLWTPWQGLGQTATGATEVAARTRAGRWGVLPKGMQALAGMQYQLGGADYVTHVTRSVAAVAQLRQTARYMPAARRLGELLDQNKTRLARVREDARQAAVRRGRSEGEVDLAGDNAVHREFKGLARQAGFGHRWNIAADMQQHGLLNRGILDAMEAAGEATGGITRTRFRQYLDPQRLASGMDDMSPEQAALVQEGIRRLQNQVERNINRRVSMPGIHQRATDEADRSWYGKVSMVLTGFARSWWQNNVIDMANMPTRTGIALMGSFITSQILLNSIRRVLRGETVDEVMAEAEENPYRYALTNAAYLPMLGPYNMMIGWSIDSAFGDTPWRQDVNSGVSGRVMNDTFDLAQATVRAPAQAAAGEETDIPGAALRAGSMFIPGYNSWWWNSLGLSYRKAMEDQPHQSLFPTRTDPSRQVPFQPGSIEPETNPRPSDDEVRELISSLGLSEN